APVTRTVRGIRRRSDRLVPHCLQRYAAKSQRGHSEFQWKRRKALPLPTFSQPCRLALLHIGPRFLRREKLSTFELPEGPLDLFGDLDFAIVEQLILGVQH